MEETDPNSRPRQVFLKPIWTIDGKYWSGYGDVAWNLVINPSP